jgi:hypothetical protein
MGVNPYMYHNRELALYGNRYVGWAGGSVSQTVRPSQAWRPRVPSEIPDAVAKYAGLWWPNNASGQFQADDLHLSRKGNPYLRYYVLEAAENMRQSIPALHAYFSRKYDQATTHKHKRAIVLTGSKCLDLFVTLLRRKEVYRSKEVVSL